MPLGTSVGLGKGQEEASQPSDWVSEETLHVGMQFLGVPGTQSARRSREGSTEKDTGREDRLKGVTSPTGPRKRGHRKYDAS